MSSLLKCLVHSEEEEGRKYCTLLLISHHMGILSIMEGQRYCLSLLNFLLITGKKGITLKTLMKEYKLHGGGGSEFVISLQ